MTRRLLLLLTVVIAFGVTASNLYGTPDAIAIDEIVVGPSDADGADVSFHVKSHVDLDVNCSWDGGTAGPGTNYTVTTHFPVGPTTITCTDSAENKATETVTVTYDPPPPPPGDTTAPTLTVPGDSTVEATSSAGAVVSYTASATDDTDPAPVVNCSPASGSTFALGATTVNCTATDSSTNSSNGSFTITVVDTTPPALSLPADINTSASSSSGAVVTFSASASDAVSGSVAVSCSPSSGSTFPIGTTTVNCSATDGAGKTANGSFNVTVNDDGGPQFSNVPGTVTIEANGPSGAVANYTAPSATDAIDGPSIVTCSPPSGSLFPLGSTTVTCSASDNHSNSNSASFAVLVVDTTPPTLLVPANSSAYATTPSGLAASGYGLSQFLSGAHASDLVDPNPHVVTNAGDFLSVGVHTITFTAVDASGNTTVKSAVFEVLPMPAAGTPPLPLPPNVHAPPNVTGFKAVAGDGRVQLSWKIPSGVDHVVITRTLTAGGDPQRVYSGSGLSFVDRGVVNGLEYRYVIVSVDDAGNESPGAAAVALPKRALLRSPKDGAKLAKPPKLLWVKNSEAAYYNVQLFRGKTKILSTWPVGTSLGLKHSWKYQGRKFTLTRGTYRWYVWPGFGARAAVDYGELLGSRTFRITR